LDAKSSDLREKVTGILATYSYKSEDGSIVQIFDLHSISNLVAVGLSIASDEEKEDYNEIWAGASLSLCTVVFSWMLAQQKLDHIASRLQLSSDAHEKVSMDEGFSRLASLRRALERTEGYLKKLDSGDLSTPGTSEGSVQKNERPE